MALIIQWRIEYGIVDGVEGTIKMTENEVYRVSLEAVQKSEESIELKQNQVYGIHAGYQQQRSEDILVTGSLMQCMECL